MTIEQIKAIIEPLLPKSDRGYMIEIEHADIYSWAWAKVTLSYITEIVYDKESDPTIQREPECVIGTETIVIDYEGSKEYVTEKVLARIAEIEETEIKEN